MSDTVHLNCSEKLVNYIKTQIDSKGVFKFGLIWGTEYPIETFYIGIDDIPKTLHEDYYLFVDNLVSCFGENVLKGEISNEDLSVIRLSTTRTSYDPLSESIGIDEASVLSKEEIEEIITLETRIREDGFGVVSIDYDLGDDYIDYRLQGFTTIPNTLFPSSKIS